MPFEMKKKRQKGKPKENGSLKGLATGLMDFVHLFMDTKFWDHK